MLLCGTYKVGIYNSEANVYERIMLCIHVHTHTLYTIMHTIKLMHNLLQVWYATSLHKRTNHIMHAWQQHVYKGYSTELKLYQSVLLIPWVSLHVGFSKHPLLMHDCYIIGFWIVHHNVMWTNHMYAWQQHVYKGYNTELKLYQSVFLIPRVSSMLVLANIPY